MDGRAALRHGVLETHLEGMILPQQVGEIRSAFGAFKNALDRRAGATVMTSNEDPRVLGLGLSDETLRFVRRDLAGGYVVVMPKKFRDEGQGVSRWRVHVGTGETLGMIANGWGGAEIVKEGALQTIGTQGTLQLAKKKLGPRIVCLFIIATIMFAAALTFKEAITCALGVYAGFVVIYKALQSAAKAVGFSAAELGPSAVRFAEALAWPKKKLAEAFGTMYDACVRALGGW